ncbi:MAG: DHH family phosphoesterase, partial [Lachnospiraceae bacterium]|nr:DHH family phosphoesterase [Lachnospiraceae bacterium]
MKNHGIKLKAVIFLLIISIAGSFTGCQSNNKKSGLAKEYEAIYKAVDYGDGDIYVIGHKSPDSDAVCSAIGYAEVLSKIGINCKARVTAKPNPETQFALDYFKVETPEILENAAGKNIILVDHNMYSQAADGMEEANIVGIMDHHNLGDIQTSAPIVVKELPLGCTATGIY